MRVRLSVTELFYNACIASDGYRTVFLQSLGITAGRIGIISSLSTIANIIAPPIWGLISDKIRSPRICFALCLGLSAILLAAVPFTSQVGAPFYILMIGCLALASMFTGPANNMMEMWLVRVDNSGIGISYGSVRLWASIGYALMGIFYTYILEDKPVSLVYYLYFIYALPAILIALTLPDPNAAEKQQKKKLRFRDLPLKRIMNYWIAVYLMVSASLKVIFDVVTAYPFEHTGPHGLPNHSQYLHAPQFRDAEEIQHRYGRSIPPEAGSQRRTGQGQERKGKEIEETGCGCQPAVGWKILTDTMKAMTSNAPWPILFC